MPNNQQATFKVEDARLIFRNFAGKEGPYNSAGERNFCVLLDDQIARKLAKDGWNVKTLAPRETDEGEEGQPYIQVKVNFKNRPPRVVLLTSTGRTHLNEDTVEMLDGIDIKEVDLICRAYEWHVGDKGGIKAYLQSMYVTMEEDDLDRKYAGVGE